MPKRRALQIEVKPSMVIVCEGKINKSECAYIESYINHFTQKGSYSGNIKNIIKIQDTGINTPYELVSALSEYDGDQYWAVFDKDGHPKMNETAQEANARGYKIAFNSISFEFWLLLHFGYTTKPFLKSDEAIKEIVKVHHFQYSKSDEKCFESLIGFVNDARVNAKRLRKDNEKTSKKIKPYPYMENPYTNMDELLDDIDSVLLQYCKK